MATQANKPLKGILKKPKTTPASPSLQTTITTTTNNSNKADPRAIAIHHARLLEDRKAAEAAIFDNILALLDYPLHPSQPPASSPHPSDTEGFAALVRMLQPSDYDDLVVERNLNGDRCGYALCPRRRRRFPGAGTYKMVNKGRRDFDIVETRELERWCSAECTRRALWVKVQLNETAAWERAGLPELRIELYPEKDGGGGGASNEKEKPKAASAEQQQPGEGKERQQQGTAISNADLEGLAAKTPKVQLREDQDLKAAEDNAALSLERGDDVSGLPTRSVDIVIREKTVTTQAEAPSLGDDLVKEDTIEGYRAKFRGGAEQPKGNESDEDSDWGI